MSPRIARIAGVPTCRRRFHEKEDSTEDVRTPSRPGSRGQHRMAHSPINLSWKEAECRSP